MLEEPLMTLRILAVVFIVVALFATVIRGDESPSPGEPGCAAAVDRFFADEVWAKVGSQSCLQCHKTGGDAEESAFVLVDPLRVGLGAGLRAAGKRSTNTRGTPPSSSARSKAPSG